MKRLKNFREIRGGELYLLRNTPQHARATKNNLDMIVRSDVAGDDTFWKCTPIAANNKDVTATSYLFEDVFENLEVYELEGKDLPLFISLPWKDRNFEELIKLGRTKMVEM